MSLDVTEDKGVVDEDNIPRGQVLSFPPSNEVRMLDDALALSVMKDITWLVVIIGFLAAFGSLLQNP